MKRRYWPLSCEGISRGAEKDGDTFPWIKRFNRPLVTAMRVPDISDISRGGLTRLGAISHTAGYARRERRKPRFTNRLSLLGLRARSLDSAWVKVYARAIASRYDARPRPSTSRITYSRSVWPERVVIEPDVPSLRDMPGPSIVPLTERCHS